MKGVTKHLCTVSEQLEGLGKATQVHRKQDKKGHGTCIHILQRANKEHSIQKIKTLVLKKTAKETGNFPQVLNAMEGINQNVFNKTRKVRLQEVRTKQTH